jgi:hypothetical protein
MTRSRLARAGEHTLAAGLELWFSPVPVNLEPGALPGYFARCAREAERLRRAHEGRVVLMLGCEISLWCAGFLPGGDSVLGRIATVTDPALQRKPDVMAALASGLERARHTLRDIVRAAREKFAGPVTYAAAPWETVDWELFDLVSVDLYRDSTNAAGYRDALRSYTRFGRPVAVTEFGCCTYRGAAGRGGMGWMIVDEKSDPLGHRQATTRSCAPHAPRGSQPCLLVNTKTAFASETSGAPLPSRGRSLAAPSAYRRNAARTAAAVELKYSGGSMKPHSLNAAPLVRARR